MLSTIAEEWEGKIKPMANKRKENRHAEKEAMQNIAWLSLSSDCKISMRKA